MTKPPEVEEGCWITLSNNLDGYVLRKFSERHLAIGYRQTPAKAVKDEVIWTDRGWQFKYDGVSGITLDGPDAWMVKQGPKGLG